MQLIEACLESGAEVRAVSPCQLNTYSEALEKLGVPVAQIRPNDSRFDAFLQEYQPEVVIFDRFMIEEQFSWRVREVCPDALRVLDTCDLHSLRRARQRGAESGEGSFVSPLHSELVTDDSVREIASIHRSDLSLVISEAELSYLTDRAGIQPERLHYCPLYYREVPPSPAFDSRRNFVSIGNFNHPPNSDSFRWLHSCLWNPIRNEILRRTSTPCELHIYGAYPSESFLSLDNSTSGFRVMGRAKDLVNTLGHYRVNLAPLRFGAGLKGKILDGWASGTPCVSTSIGAEGIGDGTTFGGRVTDDPTLFVESAVELYLDAARWENAHLTGIAIINRRFTRSVHAPAFIESLKIAVQLRDKRRQTNLVGAMLWHHLNRSTEYMSRWIEAKNKLLARSQ